MKIILFQVVIFIVTYLSFTQILLGAGSALSTLIVRELRRGRGRVTRDEVPKPKLSSRVNEAISFTLREDKRQLERIGRQRKDIYLGIVGVGALLGLALLLIFGFTFSLLALPVSLGASIFAYKSAIPILRAREEALIKLSELKRSKMGLASDSARKVEEVIVTAWDDYVYPVSMRMAIPMAFDDLNQGNILIGLNTHFGRGRSWVPNLEDEEYPGWCFDKGMASFLLMKPLPTRADWSAHYVLDERIAWSFFPLGLGNEGGVPVVNPNTGEEERVIGFDVFGGQGKLASKQGFRIGSEITQAPQVLIAGGTGGGKALSVDTKVLVKRESEK